jgi:peptide-methionine (S)-S-oxide reductase
MVADRPGDKEMMTRSLAAVALLAAAGIAGDAQAETQSAVFAGGCFWCVEEAFDAVPGVVATTSGYTGGTVANPTYRDVSAGGTGHVEAVKVDYDAARVSYEQLLETFWRNIDPFDPAGQFCDKGSSYRSGVFVATEEERGAAETTKAVIAKRFDMPVATEIVPEQTFYPAEDYHQNFHETNPARYKYYKWGCGRAQRLEEIWGKPAT